MIMDDKDFEKEWKKRDRHENAVFLRQLKIAGVIVLVGVFFTLYHACAA